MNYKELKERGLIIFECIAGSKAYGTNIPTSDTDIRYIYKQPNEDILGYGKYKEQVNDNTNDCVGYEVKRFLELLKQQGPNCLELLYSPEDCILETSPQFKLIVDNRDKFLTKKCRDSFGGYAVAQIKKAKGLNKKMNWEKGKVTRKDLLDFVYVIQDGKSIPWRKWNGSNAYEEKFIGAVKVPNAKDVYALYYDKVAELLHSEKYPEAQRETNKQILRDSGKPMGKGYKGLFKVGDVEDSGKTNFGISNQLRLSSVPIGETSFITVVYNKDGYSEHCKDYNEYVKWLENRNTQRYVDIEGHGQQIDGKNLLHCRRLLDVAMEIPTLKTILVKRPNANELLDIRKGKVDLDTIIDKAEEDIKLLDDLYLNSSLPDKVDEEFLNDLLIQIRNL